MRISENKLVIMNSGDDDDLSKEIVALLNFKLKVMNKSLELKVEESKAWINGSQLMWIT